MKTENFTTIVLTAEEGKFLTQSGDTDILDRIVATTVAIGRSDSPDKWHEITAEEAESIRAAQEEERKRIQQEMELSADKRS